MVNIINVADLVDPGDFQGRTYRQINSELKHQFAVGDLIELTMLSNRQEIVTKHHYTILDS
jgi:hypothetical protein